MVKRMTSVSVHVYLIITVLISKTLTFVVTLECDFDKDYCGWQQDEFDDFDWERDSEDHFIYIDAFEKSEGAKSKLISPMQSSGQYCMTFWYSLYGDGIEALNVYIAEPEEKKKVIFAKSDNIFSIKWWKSVLNINTTDSFQIVLEGVVAKDGSYSYIDINHISIKSGYCSADCDFDDDFCNWMQYHGDDFNWDRMKGETSSSYTGPSADHTSGRKQSLKIVFVLNKSSVKSKLDSQINITNILSMSVFSFYELN